MKRRGMTDAYGIPLGRVLAGAARFVLADVCNGQPNRQWTIVT